MIPLAVIMFARILVSDLSVCWYCNWINGWKLIVAAALNILWGALMDIGFGLYAPCMATCLLLGVDAATCFPVFMGSCACLMPACSIEFIKSHRYDVHIQLVMRSVDVSVYLLHGNWLQDFRCSGSLILICIVLLWTSYTLLSAAKKDKAKGIA